MKPSPAAGRGGVAASASGGGDADPRMDAGMTRRGREDGRQPLGPRLVADDEQREALIGFAPDLAEVDLS
ncbi:MAG: hypothetical protein U0470_01045 [Anaerolineae bacterium]